MPTARITTQGQAGDVRLISKRIPFEEIQGMLRRPKHKMLTIREMDRSIEQ